MLDRLAEPDTNISHSTMPTWHDHVKFIKSSPYTAWYVIMRRNSKIGVVYLTKHNEVGVYIKKEFRRKGYAAHSIKLMMEKFRSRRFLANINPSNKASISLFEGLGFGHIQNTYSKVE